MDSGVMYTDYEERETERQKIESIQEVQEILDSMISPTPNDALQLLRHR